MNRSTWIKRAVATFLVVLMSIESFAAVVGDNDGAAFITKAEFESLKNDFQTQINRYNTSLDNKIDGAIASYLNGVRVAKTSDLKPIVEKYKDIYWLHDFSLVSYQQTMTSRTAKSKSAVGDYQPNYSNRAGWSFYPQNRGLKLTAYGSSNLALVTMYILLKFDSDGTYTKTSCGSARGTLYVEGSPPAIIVGVDDKGVMLSQPLYDLWECYYHGYGFGSSVISGGWINNDGEIAGPLTFTPVNTTIDGTYAKINVTNKNGNTYAVEWTEQNSEVWDATLSRYGYGEHLGGVDDTFSNRLTFPLYCYYAPSLGQRNKDEEKIYNMMIGYESTFKLPILFNLKSGGRTGSVGSWFPDWSRWDKKSLSTRLEDSSLWCAGSGSVSATITDRGSLECHVDSSSTGDLNVMIPVTTLFDVKEIKSPIVKVDGENLSVCAGIPIVQNVTNDGVVKVSIKCNKYYDNITKTSPTNTNANIRFKKTNYLNNMTDYLSGTINNSSSDVTFDTTCQKDLSDITFNINVKKDESVWMNIDPLTLGQHIKISSLSAQLITE